MTSKTNQMCVCVQTNILNANAEFKLDRYLLRSGNSMKRKNYSGAPKPTKSIIQKQS
jgi:hypothetical protein